MVNLLLLFVAFLPAYLVGADVKVDATINEESRQEKQPLTGSIAITHDSKDKVDPKSFRLNDKPLPAEFVQETKFAPDSSLVISFYRFTIEGQPKGLHILPAVKVLVGGQDYESLPTTYEVGETAVPKGMPRSSTTGKAAMPSGRILNLDATVQGPAELYPGQRIKVIYRYTFNDNIELTKEELPLLQGEGFAKIGALETKDENQGAVSIHEISQILEALKPGHYKFDTSHIEGYVYRSDPFGSRIYLKPILQADAPSKVITVVDFPAEGKPPSFNGAIGPFTNFEVQLKTPDHLNVGDKLVLELDLTGTGQLEQAPLPALCCLPGFSGVFSQSDIPPREEIKGPTKSFYVEMRPLTANVKEIPSIDYAFFIPQTKKYGILKSKPITISVTAIAVPPPPQPVQTTPLTPEQPLSKTPGPIEIFGSKKLYPSDLMDYRFGQWWVLMLVPLAAAAIVLQIFLRNYFKNYKPVETLKTSELYLSEALKADPASSLFYQLLSKALILRLVEKGIIKQAVGVAEQLPAQGVAGEVKTLLTRIEERRFTGQEPVVDKALISEAKSLYRKI